MSGTSTFALPRSLLQERSRRATSEAARAFRSAKTSPPGRLVRTASLSSGKLWHSRTTFFSSPRASAAITLSTLAMASPTVEGGRVPSCCRIVRDALNRAPLKAASLDQAFASRLRKARFCGTS